MPDGVAYPWPRAMRAERAAAYLDVSTSWFHEHVARAVPPVRLSAGVVVWLREDLDAWLDSRACNRASSEAGRNPWHT
jgi:predicted DNA-binding transcriptional regulator AlpA